MRWVHPKGLLSPVSIDVVVQTETGMGEVPMQTKRFWKDREWHFSGWLRSPWASQRCSALVVPHLKVEYKDMHIPGNMQYVNTLICFSSVSSFPC